ncbi:MAG: DUF3667 domain-containing protein [Lewinellaceae bacterium]|nr:DUF3667 domain-containing protein [Saprospiraceae bacterium]MCB9330380.1 DUF3667 domain-containing protein [Lewinellaceae bacterium]
MEEAAKCLNCGKPLKSKHRFCPKCGQSAKTRRFSLREVRKEMQKRVLHAEAGIVQLTWALALRPGQVALEYVEGKRKKYYSPLKYLTLSAAVSVFINEYFHLLDNMHLHPNPGTEIATRFFNIIILFSVPISALASWPLFRKKGVNYAENLVLHAYLGGFRTVFFILIFTPLVVWFPEYYYRVLSIYFAIWFAYMTWAMVQFFGDSVWLTVLKAFLVLLVNQIVITAAIFAGILIRLRT